MGFESNKTSFLVLFYPSVRLQLSSDLMQVLSEFTLERHSFNT